MLQAKFQFGGTEVYVLCFVNVSCTFPYVGQFATASQTTKDPKLGVSTRHNV